MILAVPHWKAQVIHNTGNRKVSGSGMANKCCACAKIMYRMSEGMATRDAACRSSVVPEFPDPLSKRTFLCMRL